MSQGSITKVVSLRIVLPYSLPEPLVAVSTNFQDPWGLLSLSWEGSGMGVRGFDKVSSALRAEPYLRGQDLIQKLLSTEVLDISLLGLSVAFPWPVLSSRGFWYLSGRAAVHSSVDG